DYSNLITKNLEQQKARALLPYAAPQAEQQLLKAQLFNKFYGPNIQSEMGLRGAQAKQAQAQAGYLGTESDINRYKLQNPIFLNTEAAILADSLKKGANQNISPQNN